MNNNIQKISLTEALEAAASWLSEGKGVAIGRVLSTWGSSPRPTGSLLAVNENSNFAGSVSGGCIEGAVIKEALDVITTGKPQVLVFDVSNKYAWEVGLACGGRVEVYVERVKPEILRSLLSARALRRPVAWLTYLTTESHLLLYPEQADTPDCPIDTELSTIVEQCLQNNCSQIIDCEPEKIFVNVFNPRLRLIIIGAVHIAQSLAPMAAIAGYEVIVVDPRHGFASRSRFPDTHLINEWPNDALQRLTIDQRTAIVTLTHDPKLDDAALSVALHSSAFYIGSLGSKKTQHSRLQRLAEKGFTESQLSSIHGPVGLDLGARSPAEISIAILAEMTQSLQKEGLNVLR